MVAKYRPGFNTYNYLLLFLDPAYAAAILPSQQKGGGMAKEKTVTNEMIEEAYRIIAGIVRDHGDKYLPVFKRLHEERAHRQANQDLKNIALQVAGNPAS